LTFRIEMGVAGPSDGLGVMNEGANEMKTVCGNK
jgi:hypothetical protein